MSDAQIIRFPIHRVRTEGIKTCPECGLRFDLTNEDDNAEWHYGHDCEA
jgi:hypothetical protein